MADTKKRNVSKRTRFEIFKRDGFTCQYCGAQPPSVVLVVDHIHPKALDGSCDPINLITACEACNQGKADKPLGDVHPRPDADAMYLETMQEIGELKRFKAAQDELQAHYSQVIEGLQETWCFISELDWCPSTAELMKMVRRGALDICHETITVTALAFAEGRCNDETWLKYMWAVFYRKERGEQNV